MKNILLPYEFHLENGANLLMLKRISEKTHASITVIHCLPQVLNEGVSGLFINQKVKELEERIYRDMVLQVDEYPDLDEKWLDSIKIKIRLGKYQDEIPFELKTSAYDHISFTVPVKPNKYAFANGKNIQELMERIQTPTLFIPEGMKTFNLKEILYCTNLSRNKDSEPFIWNAMKFAQYFDAKIHFVNLTEANKPSYVKDVKTLDKIKKLLHVSPERYKQTFLTCQSYIEEIKAKMDSRDYSLIIAIKENRNFFNELFIEGFVNNISINIKKPVLIYHENEIHNK